jgi:dihydroxy-acid dehydratase
MDDFYRAGWPLAVLREICDLIDPTAVTVTGRPLVDYLDTAPIWDCSAADPTSPPSQASPIPYAAGSGSI